MSIAENKAVIHSLVEILEKHDIEAIWNLFAPDCRFSVLKRFGIEPTFENYRAFIASFMEALPDVHHTIEGMVAEGEKVWVNYTIQGTHEGLLRNVPATHRQVNYSLIAMYRVAGGKIRETDFQSDDLSLLRQLGAIPA